MRSFSRLFLAAVVSAMTASAAQAGMTLRVTIENRAPVNGLNLTPVWVGAHNGSFDLFNAGQANFRPGLERIAEDGDVTALRSEFGASNSGKDGVVAAPAGFAGAPVFEPGEKSYIDIVVDPAKDRYFSYASMIIPSNDAFIGNDDPKAFRLFSANGTFTPVSFTVRGSRVWDAGTEANNEMEAAFLNQTGPDMGATETLPVRLHPGFIDSLANPGGSALILGGTAASGQLIDPIDGDFSQPGYEIARITVSAAPAVPLPPAVWGGLAMLACVAGHSYLRKRNALVTA